MWWNMINYCGNFLKTHDSQAYTQIVLIVMIQTFVPLYDCVKVYINYFEENIIFK
jgi:hypothetical protein